MVYGSSTGLGLSAMVELEASDLADGDRFGFSLALGGDVDGDGYDELLVGSPRQDGAGTDAGAAYLYLGSATGLVVSSEVQLHAEDASNNDYFGYAVPFAGDLDGAGDEELVVGAPYQDEAGSGAGAVYVYEGADGGVGEGARFGPEGLQAGDRFGASLAAAGDVDGDGFGDLVVGAVGDDEDGEDAGAAWLLFGGPGGLSSSRVQELRSELEQDEAEFGAAVAGGRDLDADGYDDVLVGARRLHRRQDRAGSVFAFHGGAGGAGLAQEYGNAEPEEVENFGSSLALADVDGDLEPEALVGAPSRDQDGEDNSGAFVLIESVAGLGLRSAGGWSGGFGDQLVAADLDGDGWDELVVSSTTARSLFLVPGSGGGLDRGAERRLGAPAVDMVFPYGLAALGDLDGDGKEDLGVHGMVGDEHAVYLYFGPLSASGARPSRQLEDPSSTTTGGYAYALAAGDADGDGHPELAVGAGKEGPNSTGAVFLYEGSATGPVGEPTTFTASDGAYYAYFGETLAWGDFDQDGFEDLVVGSPSDLASGAVYVHMGSASGLPASSDHELTSADGGDYLGLGMASLDGQRLAVGAVEDNDGHGAVYLLCEDLDRDGYCADADCDDEEGGVHPGAEEIEDDGVDQDCNGEDLTTEDSEPEPEDSEPEPVDSEPEPVDSEAPEEPAPEEPPDDEGKRCAHGPPVGGWVLILAGMGLLRRSGRTD